MKFSTAFVISALLAVLVAFAEPGDHLVFEGESGPGKGKHIVFLSGDEEYRSEESMPLMAQILAKQGFKCTVLFSLDEEGFVDPTQQASLSHPEALDTADALVMVLRFRNWPDATMKRFEATLNRAVPIVALRTSTHAFKFPETSRWAKYSFDAKPETGWAKGFGRQILGETWVNHHGKHRVQGTRSAVEQANKTHPVLNGVGTIFAESDVYGVNPPADVKILLRGQVTESLKPDSKAVGGKKNSSMMPVAWIRQLEREGGERQKIFTTTMGAASDLDDANLRRLVVNAVFWSLDIKVPDAADVRLPGVYEPTFYGFKSFKKGLKPNDFILKPAQEEEALMPSRATGQLQLKRDARIGLVGNGIASRMHHFGCFETELFQRYPQLNLYIRNFADEGNTPAFHPHPGRSQQVSFAGGEVFLPQELQKKTGARGSFETPDQWLARHKIDTILAFYGSVSSFRGRAELPRFREELDAYLKHLKAQNFSGDGAPQIVLISPTAVQDLRHLMDLPNPEALNADRNAYTAAMEEVASVNGVKFVNVFASSAQWFSTKEPFTVDGLQLNEKGYQKLAPFLADQIFGQTKETKPGRRGAVRKAVVEKNFFWKNDFKVPNGIHVYGRRYRPFGHQNYPDELKKTRELTAIRDQNIWAIAQGKSFDIVSADAKSHPLPPVPSNYRPSKKNGTSEYQYGDDAVAKLEVAEGYQIELFADERQFPRLANPVQMSFDNRGRLWVACMPSYPHYRVGDPRPADTLLILEDTDGDNRADKETVFAEDLHLPMGFEITHEGVYVSQSDSLILLVDDDGDDRYDRKEIIYSGFDDHDSHHAISAFTAGPSGAIFLSEGTFLHSNVETPYGTIRGSNGGFFRFNPVTRHLERTAQLRIPNPWGTAFDDWGQAFVLQTSNVSLNWLNPGMVKSRYGYRIRASENLIKTHAVRPTSGLEIVSSRHFPEEVQGDLLINNTIGFLGTKQHRVEEDGTGYKLSFRQNLLQSSDGNFRPVDLEFAPDGSLYLIDWSNALIGHMQHNTRDPYRDHVHGRVYRITYPDRPLIKPSKIADASISDLLGQLKLPEYRTRYRVKRELRGRPVGKVLPALNKWVNDLDQTDEDYHRHLAEAMWVSWGLNEIDAALVRRLLESDDHRARAAAVRAVRYNLTKIPGAQKLLEKAAADEHGRVRVEAIVAASWVGGKKGRSILAAAKSQPIDKWMEAAYNQATAVVEGSAIEAEQEGPKLVMPEHLKSEEARESYKVGHEVYHREAHCATCHQTSGKGLHPTYPPLAGSQWVTGDVERLTKLALHGISGEIEVNGETYGENMPPMTAFGGLLDDKELAAVLTYVRNSWGNQAKPVSFDQVAQIRKRTESRKDYWSAEELLADHPMQRRKVVTGGILPDPNEKISGGVASSSAHVVVVVLGVLGLSGLGLFFPGREKPW